MEKRLGERVVRVRLGYLSRDWRVPSHATAGCCWLDCCSDGADGPHGRERSDDSDLVTRSARRRHTRTGPVLPTRRAQVPRRQPRHTHRQLPRSAARHSSALLACLHRECAENITPRRRKKNRFSFVRIFLMLDRNCMVNFFHIQ